MAGSTWSRGLASSVLGAVVGGITFAPEPGTELRRRWSEKLSIEVDSLEETIGGNPVDLPFSSIELEEERAFEVADVLTRSEGGRPVDLKRRFSSSSLGLAARFDGRPLGHVAGRAACDESAVRFVFETDEERYRRERIEGEIDAERMERLEPDLDLLELLPASDLEPGGSWKLEPEVLRRFFAAGGDVGFEPGEVVAEMGGVPREILVAGALGSVHELFGSAAEISGKVLGTYVGDEKDEAGAPLARLEFEVDVETEIDLGERLQALMDENALPGRREFHTEGELDGSLVVLWDLAQKRLRSARFEGDAKLAGHVVFPVQLAEGQPSVTFVGDYELSGDATVELAIE